MSYHSRDLKGSPIRPPRPEDRMLTCGHYSKGYVVVSVAGSDRRRDLYQCSQGCGLQRRSGR